MTTSVAYRSPLVVPSPQMVPTPEGASGVTLDCRPYAAQIQQAIASRRPVSLADTERFLVEAEMLFHALPEPLRRAVIELKSGLSRYPFLILKGLPTEQSLPPTPLDSRRPRMERFMVGEWLSAAIAKALGEPFGLVQQNEGELIQHNSPVKLHETAQSGESSKTELLFHTDGSFLPLTPDYNVISCLRPDPAREAVTSFTSLEDLLAELSPKHRELLSQPRFLADGVEYDYDEVNERGNRTHHVPLLRGTAEQPYIFYDQDIHRAVDAEAAEALRALDAALEAKAIHVKLEAGDVALFDNRRCMHKRSPFHANYDGKDRWCLLTYVSSSALEATRERRAAGRRRVLDIPANL
ncbi:TauD/TfdA family dioxygenase [Hyalangium rubrum]|uniref:TauD/TfdA family dioxygenase n=1 Tax=Hyalangium rubrum TaxID=3103134 RepID=A0ABU5GWA1_9BACT|nr:TauD/TfdA family dioxygenase [Hyalangium sp. s54d21]MDY7225471.1 TauD/TfdA family dioxygenase [Hyalangium sp. s54d21]